MMLALLVLPMLVVAALPLLMTLWNLSLYRRAASPAPAEPAEPAALVAAPLIGVCIPARDEEENIGAIVRSVLANDHPALRVYVYDDQSADRTPEILAELASEDERVRLVPVVSLPTGWAGKQHACWRAAQHALAEGAAWLLFTDADVRLAPDALRRTLAEAERPRLAGARAELVSCFPRQITRSLPEHLLVPMMFYLLLGYLPIARMRATLDPATSAGCGQYLFVSREAYEATGGHEAFRDSYHDGIRMPRAVRRAGMVTDLFDGTDLAHVRMYRGWEQTWRGFAKNAYEGLGSPVVLVVFTLLHLIGHVGPWLVLLGELVVGLRHPWAVGLAAAAAAAPIVQRLVLAVRLRHHPAGAVLHPVGICLMTAIQWTSFWLHLSGRRAWRGRVIGQAP